MITSSIVYFIKESTKRVLITCLLYSALFYSIKSRNFVESDHGCTSSIFYDNAGDNVALTLYNVTLMSHYYVNKITSVIAAKQTVINEVHVVVVCFFSIKYRYNRICYWGKKT